MFKYITMFCFIILTISASDISPLFKTKVLGLSTEEFEAEYFDGFRWSDEGKTTARSRSQNFLDEKLVETIAKFNDGKLVSLTGYLWTRGDSRQTISEKGFKGKFKSYYLTVKKFCNNKNGERNSRQGLSKNKSYQWKLKDHTLQLIASSSKRPFKAEYFALQISAVNKASRKDKSSLKAGLVRKRNGDVYIQGIPMIDQGSKGYCVCATTARVLNYYGRAATMHEVAKMAGGDPDNGTSIEDMIKAIDKVKIKLRIKMDYIRVKNEIAKFYNKAYKTRYPKNIHSFYREYEYFDDMLDQIPDKTSSLRNFMRDVKKSIDKGVPIAWTMYVGIHEEAGIEAGSDVGGHMRMIIGYNEKTQEIIYSDSWGPGHEIKRWSVKAAYSVTVSLISISPR